MGFHPDPPLLTGGSTTPKPKPNNYKYRTGCAIDWITASIHEDSLDDMVQIARQLWPEPGEAGRRHLRAYEQSMRFEPGLTLAWSQTSGETALWDMTGMGCDRFTLAQQIDITRDLLELGANPTRIDLAVDYHFEDGAGDGIIEEAYASCNRGELKSPKRFMLIEPRTNKLDLAEGHTLYFGSNQSEAQARLYDKGLESGEQPKGHWLRFEGQFKSSKARHVSHALVSSLNPAHDLGSLALGLVTLTDDAGFVRQGGPASWLDQISGQFEPRKVPSVRRRRTWDGCRDNMRRVFGPRIQGLAAASGLSVEEIARMVFADLPPEHRRVDDVTREFLAFANGISE